MQPTRAISGLVDHLGRSIADRPSRHLNSDLDAPCAQPKSVWLTLIPARLVTFWAARAEQRHRELGLARLQETSPHLLLDIGAADAPAPPPRRHPFARTKTRPAPTAPLVAAPSKAPVDETV